MTMYMVVDAVVDIEVVMDMDVVVIEMDIDVVVIKMTMDAVVDIEVEMDMDVVVIEMDIDVVVIKEDMDEIMTGVDIEMVDKAEQVGKFGRLDMVTSKYFAIHDCINNNNQTFIIAEPKSSYLSCIKNILPSPNCHLIINHQ